jgi:hypothetical protein
MRATFLLSFVLAAGACSPYSPDLGYSPFFCGSGMPACPDGYTCMGGGGSGSGAGSGTCISTTGKPTDGGNNNGMCADDSQVEGPGKNDTIMTAYALPDLSTRTDCTITYTSLAICPMGDKDNYSFILAVDGKTVQADMTYDSWGAPLQGAIANSGGTPIKTLLPTSTTNQVSGAATNLPMGQYFVEIFGPAAAPGINNYKLTITMTPCP